MNNTDSASIREEYVYRQSLGNYRVSLKTEYDKIINLYFDKPDLFKRKMNNEKV